MAVDRVIGFVLLAVIAGMAVWGLTAALETGGESHVVENETWQPDAGNVTQLDESFREGAIYGDEVEVRDENGTVATAGADYAWHATNGTVAALEGGILENDTNATISYSFAQTTAEQREWAAILSMLPYVFGIALPLGALLLLLSVIRGGF